MTTKNQCPVEAAREWLDKPNTGGDYDSDEDLDQAFMIVENLLAHIDEQKRLDEQEPVVEIEAGNVVDVTMSNGRDVDFSTIGGRYRREREGEK